MSPAASRMIVALVVAAGLFTAGWTVNGWRLGRQAADLRADQQAAISEAQQDARRIEGETAARVAALDRQHTQELTNAQNKIDRLRADVAAGHRRVYVRASCPDVSAPGAAAGMDHGAAAELDPAARQHYLDLRAKLRERRIQILALQDYIRALLGQQRGQR